MRVVWKDSFGRRENGMTSVYRRHAISAHGNGWVTDIIGDNNVYSSKWSAMNAIDQHYGDFAPDGSKKRFADGIKVIGQKNETA